MRKFIVLFMTLLFISCAQPGIKQEVKSIVPETDFHVAKLFDIKGASIYRFYDGGRYHYFLLGDGEMTNQTKSETTGKTTTTYSDGVMKSYKQP